MWFDILRSNRTAIAAAIAEYREHLSALEATLREGTEGDLLDVLARAARVAARLPTQRPTDTKDTKDAKAP